MTSRIIYSERVFWNDTFQPVSIWIDKGRIRNVVQGKRLNIPIPFEDYGNSVIMPGIIDAHIHINEPGRTEWEGFDTVTKAAAAGGITTLVDMPLNSSPVTIDKDTFQQKIAATKNQLHVNCGFWAGLVPQNSDNLDDLLTSGVLGIKAFLTHSGIDEFPNVQKADLQRAMPIIGKYNMPLLAHCELDSPNEFQALFEQYQHSYPHFVASRPCSWENEAIELMIDFCRTTKCPVHIVHLSSAEALPAIRQAKEEGLPLTVETCPHYIYFNQEEIPNSDTRFKCTPPIRDRKNNEQLWEALESGLIDFVASDHSPAPPEMKEHQTGNLYKAWGGIIGGQALLTATWAAAQKRNISLKKIVQWLCEKPAQFIGFGHRKGKIKTGYDADFVIWNPEEIFELTEEMLLHRHKFSPYVGETLAGQIVTTFCNGEKVYNNGKISEIDQGKILLKTDSF